MKNTGGWRLTTIFQEIVGLFLYITALQPLLVGEFLRPYWTTRNYGSLHPIDTKICRHLDSIKKQNDGKAVFL